MARPERFELPTNWFEANYSIQLSYGRVGECAGGAAQAGDYSSHILEIANGFAER